VETPRSGRVATDQLTVGTGIRDERLPTAPDLLGHAGLELAARVAVEDGGRVTSIRSTQALYSPGNYAILTYEAELSNGGGGPLEQVVAVVADNDGLPDGAPVHELAGGLVAAWRFPNDPVLSCLNRLLDDQELGEMLGELDLTARWVDVTPLVYRPTLRAVIRISLKEDDLVFDRDARRLYVRKGERDIFLKVVPPEYAEEIGQIHDALGRHMSVPRCYTGWADIGLLALEGLPGLTLRDFIRVREEAPPSPDDLLAVLDTVHAGAATDDTVTSMRRRARSHERLLRVILPDHEERIRRLGRELRELPSQRPAIVHGDFYDSQVMVDHGGSVTGLLDLDGVGWGDPSDDLATMLGRVWTSGQTSDLARDRFQAYAGELLDGFSRRVDRRDLCLRVAAIVFGRCTAPFRSQVENWREQALERLELAERCLEDARRGELPA
jgi:aminoglycoside phosphotransferase